MYLIKFNIIICFYALATLGSCKKSTKNINQDSNSNYNLKRSIQDLDSQVPKWQKELQIPNVAVGIIDSGKVAFTKVYGQFNNEIAPDNLQFNIASITKVIFGTTVMKLVANGDWDLDEPLYHYYVDEDVKDDPRHKVLTSRHVLSQQSGFVNWRWNHPTQKLTFDFDPGTTFNYSGEGMEYLRNAIEHKLRKSWDEIADSLLFKPMNLQNTSHSWDGTSNFENFSRFYDSEGKEHLLDDYSFSAQAADDVMTTIKDLTTFGANLISQDYLPPLVFKDMVNSQTRISDNQEQALAWRLIRGLNDGEYAIHHGGNDIGVATLIVLLPESKRGVVILTNADAGIVMCNNIVRTLFDEGETIIHRAYRSGSIDDLPIAIDLPDEILDRYSGTYEQPSGRKVVIENSGETLLMKMPGVPNFQLYPETQNTFFLKDFDPIIEFEKQEDNTFILKIIEGENIIECQKIRS